MTAQICQYLQRNICQGSTGVKSQCQNETNPRETTVGLRYREFREIEGSRNRVSTVVRIFAWLGHVITVKALLSPHPHPLLWRSDFVISPPPHPLQFRVKITTILDFPSRQIKCGSATGRKNRSACAQKTVTVRNSKWRTTNGILPRSWAPVHDQTCELELCSVGQL